MKNSTTMKILSGLLYTLNKNNLISILLVSTLLINCNRNTQNNKTSLTIENQITYLNKAIDIEKKNIIMILGNNFKKNKYFNMIENLNTKANTIINKHKDGNKPNKQDLNLFYSYCDSIYYMYNKESLFESNNIYIENDNLLVLKILLNQYVVQTTIITQIYKSHFLFHQIKPIVVSANNQIKLGEVFSAEIYLAAIDTNYKYVVTVRGDTLTYKSNNYSDAYIPIFIDKPNKKGTYNINATMSIFHAKHEDTFDYPFIIEYEVK